MTHMRGTNINMRAQALITLSLCLGLSACADIDQSAYASPCWSIARVRDCAVVPLANIKDDARAKQFGLPPPGKTRLFIVRPYSQKPKQTTDVEVDGQRIARLAPFTYVVLDVDPGQHQMSTRTARETGLAFHAEAGQIYYFRFQIDMKFGKFTERIVVLGNKEGQKAIGQSNLVSN